MRASWRRQVSGRWLIGLLTFPLIGCSAAPTTPSASTPVTAPAATLAPVSGPTTAAPSAPSNDQVVVAINQAPPSLEPTAGSVSWNLLQLGAGETLVRLSREAKLEPWLARSWRQLNDREWEVVLRDGIKFYDGKPVDAEAVKRSLDRSVAKLPQIASLLQVEVISVTDPRTLSIKTKGPNPAVGSLLAHYNLVIHDAEAAEARPDQFATAPNLTGAFRPTEFKQDNGVKMVRNPGYWGEPSRVSTVDVRFITDAGTRLTALLSKQVDLAYQLSQDGASQAGRQPDLVVKAVTTGYQYFVVLNTTKPQFADRNVRQLLSQAVDRGALATQVLRGGAEPARGAISPIFPFALAEGYGFEPDRVRAGLEAAGWKPDPDGVRAKDGARLAFTLLTYPQRPELGQIGIALQAQLKEIGAAVEIRQVDQINEALKDPSFDAALYAVNTAPTGDPGVMLNLFYRASGPSNWGKFSAPAVDEAIDRLNTTADPGQRTELARKIQHQVLDEAPHIYLVVPKFQIGLSQRLRDYQPFPSDYYIIDNQLQASR